MNTSKQSTEELYQQLRTLIELSETVVKDSRDIPEEQKKLYLSDYQRNVQEAKTFAEERNNSFLRQLQKEVLTPWYETDDADARKFWSLVTQKKLPLEQKDHVGIILKRGHIVSPDEYELVQDSLVIWQQEKRITADQAEDLNRMIAQYELKKIK
ncbi:MAG TPA: hypothetical protein VFT16_02275 [Candidatus Saccharimonadales bacterium]|nr:hypothetical protein [Candidatus Saccharimonadales bacterium]